MPRTPELFYGPNFLDDAFVLLFSGPGDVGDRSVIRHVTLNNTSGSPVVVSLAQLITGAPPVDPSEVFYTQSIPANFTAPFFVEWVVEPDDGPIEVHGMASVADVVVIRLDGYFYTP